MSAAASAFPRFGPGLRQRVESVPVVQLPGFLVAAVLVAAGAVLRVQSMSTASGWFGDDAAVPGRIASQRLMVVAYVVGAAAMWALGRRAGFNRWPAAVTVAIYALSPLAVEVTGLVAFDNVGVPVMLVAFVAAYSQRPRVATVVLTGAAAAVAVVIEPALVALVPVLAWQVWRWSDPGSRRYATALGGSLLALVAAAGLLFSDHPSIGGVLERGSMDHRLDVWFDLDPVFLALALVSALVGLVVVAVLPSLQPLGAAALVAALLAARPGDDVAISAVAALLPFGALAIGGLADEAWSHPSRWTRGAVIVVAAAALVLAVPRTVDLSRDLVDDEAGVALGATERWVANNVPPERRIVADDALVVDLAAAGFPKSQLMPYSALERTGDLWQDFDLVVVRDGVRRAPQAYPEVADVLRRSMSLAALGTGADRVEVRRITPAGSIDAAIAEGQDVVAASAAGTALAANPGLDIVPGARETLEAGEVDTRLMTALVAVASAYPVQVEGFPADPHERNGDGLRRIVELRAATPDDAAAVAALLDVQQNPYRPVHVAVGDGGTVTVIYPPASLS
jgi:hypothetical protein